MFQPRTRRNQRPRRTIRQPLRLEALEDRTLLNASPTTVLDLNGLAVNPNKFTTTDILVRFAQTPGTPGGPTLVAGTTLGSQLPLTTNYYEVNLAKGVTVTQALAAYKGQKGVLDAEPDYDLTVSAVPNDPLLSRQWSVNKTHAEQAWNTTTGSPNIVVAVMDTGIDYNSPDLYQTIWINQAEIPNSWYTKTSAGSGYNKLVYKWQIHTATHGVITFRDLNNPVNKGLVWDNNGDGRIDAGDLLRSTRQGGWMDGSTKDGDPAHRDDLFGWNFVRNTNNPLDDNGHGTHVSGILGAVGNNRAGVAGVDWNVRIMPVKFIGSNGDGSISNFIAGLNYAIQHGAKITNNSWEGAPYSSALSSAISNARAHGQIFVAAAGNEGANDDITPDYPASFKRSLNNVVAVAATDSSDRLASFSNYGAQSVSLAAPGVNILSTLPGGRYGDMSGTSMATPEVTGALALVWGLHPSWSYIQVINQVLRTTDKLSSLQGKVASGGRLDIAAAVGASSSTSKPLPTTSVPPSTTSVPPSTTSVAPGTKTYTKNTATTIRPWSLTSSTITVPAGTTIGNIQVKINASYPTDRELYIYLVAPNGKTIALVDNRGGTGANFTNTLFSDSAATGISSGKAPFSGTYRPESPLSHLKGLSAGGTWRLMIRDSGGHGGTLHNWSLTITSGSGSTTTTSPSSSPKTYTKSAASAIKPWGTTMSTINLPAGTTLGNLQVRLNISFPADGKLYIYLIAPNGRTLALVDQRGGTGANFTNTLFSDSAAKGIGAGKAPFDGAYRPESALSHFKGMNASGGWRLAIRNYSGSSGTLRNWSLIVTPTAKASSVEDSALVDAPADDSSSPAVASETPSVSEQFLSEDGPDDANATTAGVPSDRVFSSVDFMAQLQNNLRMGKRSADNPVDPWSG
ncbi:MAG TPA: S8 family serine peptidase [Gemmataceae bacterium]